jgi:hypothetical protein
MEVVRCMKKMYGYAQEQNEPKITMKDDQTLNKYREYKSDNPEKYYLSK